MLPGVVEPRHYKSGRKLARQPNTVTDRLRESLAAILPKALRAHQRSNANHPYRTRERESQTSHISGKLTTHSQFARRPRNVAPKRISQPTSWQRNTNRELASKLANAKARPTLFPQFVELQTRAKEIRTNMKHDEPHEAGPTTGRLPGAHRVRRTRNSDRKFMHRLLGE